MGNENVLSHTKKIQRESASIMAGLSNAIRAQTHGLSVSQFYFFGIRCIVSQALLCSSHYLLLSSWLAVLTTYLNMISEVSHPGSCHSFHFNSNSNKNNSYCYWELTTLLDNLHGVFYEILYNSPVRKVIQLSQEPGWLIAESKFEIRFSDSRV